MNVVANEDTVNGPWRAERGAEGATAPGIQPEGASI